MRCACLDLKTVKALRGCLCTSDGATVLGGSLLDAGRREHRHKPDRHYAMLDLMIPHDAGAELCADIRRPRWQTWGKRTDRFAGPAALPFESR